MPSRRVSFSAALSVLLLATTAAVQAAPAVTLAQVIKKVQEQQKKTATLQADFRQEKELALMARPEVSTGTFIYSRPSNVRWTYDSPKRVQMVIAGGFLTTYYPELNKAERIGLISLCTEDHELHDKALEVARKLAKGSPTAIRWMWIRYTNSSE